MPHKIGEMQLKYVTDESGEKTAVILPIEEFEELLEDIGDMAALLERRDEPTIPFEEVVAKLKKRWSLTGLRLNHLRRKSLKNCHAR